MHIFMHTIPNKGSYSMDRKMSVNICLYFMSGTVNLSTKTLDKFYLPISL